MEHKYEVRYTDEEGFDCFYLSDEESFDEIRAYARKLKDRGCTDVEIWESHWLLAERVR